MPKQPIDSFPFYKFFYPIVSAKVSVCNIRLTLSFQLCTVFYSRVMKRQPFPTTVCGNLLDLSLPTFFRPKSAFFPNYGQYWLYLDVAWLVICTLNFRNGEKADSHHLNKKKERKNQKNQKKMSLSYQSQSYLPVILAVKKNETQNIIYTIQTYLYCSININTHKNS